MGANDVAAGEFRSGRLYRQRQDYGVGKINGVYMAIERETINEILKVFPRPPVYAQYLGQRTLPPTHLILGAVRSPSPLFGASIS
jgi:hypothetical protein